MPFKDQQAQLFADIIDQTPLQFQKQARLLIKHAKDVRILPYTLRQMLAFGQAGTNNEPYNVQNLANFSYDGIFYNVSDTALSGHEAKRINLSFKNKLGQTFKLAWNPSAEKLLEINKYANIMSLEDLADMGKVAPESYTPTPQDNKDYAHSLEEVLHDPSRIKNIQSTIEKRQVVSLVGLDAAIDEASNGLYKSLIDFLQSKEFFSDNAMHYREMLRPQGGLIRRTQSREHRSSQAEESLLLLTKYKHLLTPKDVAKHMQVLKEEDELHEVLDAQGHIKQYLSDLKELGTEGLISGKPRDVLLAYQQLHENKAVCTLPEIVPFLSIYDVKGQRMKHYEETIHLSNDYKTDFTAGLALLKPFFAQGHEWLGGEDESIPRTISESLEGLVKKRADPFLKQAQRWMRSGYAAKNAEEVVTKKSFAETREEIASIVILQRRSTMKAAYGEAIIDDRQQPAEDFKKNNDFSLDDFLDRMDDQYQFSHHKIGDWKKEAATIKQEAAIKLYAPERFTTFEELIPTFRDNFIPLTDDEKKVINDYQDIKIKALVVPDAYLAEVPFSKGERYVRKDSIEQAKKILKEHKTTVNTQYNTLDNELTNTLEEHSKVITDINERFTGLRLNEFVKIRLYGTTYADKDDFKAQFKKHFRPQYEPQDNSWYLSVQKVKTAQALKDVATYNQHHEAKLTVKIE